MTLAAQFLSTVPNLWSVTRADDKSTLVIARDEQQALEKYNMVAPQPATPEQVRPVAAVK